MLDAASHDATTPDVEAMIFDARSLGLATQCSVAADINVGARLRGLEALVAQLHLAHVHLAALHVCEQAADAPRTLQCGKGTCVHVSL